MVRFQFYGWDEEQVRGGGAGRDLGTGDEFLIRYIDICYIIPIGEFDRYDRVEIGNIELIYVEHYDKYQRNHIQQLGPKEMPI